MDRIIVLDKGKIVEEGTMKELLARGGEFQHLWEIQNKE
jgi:ABC-type multidrug transport system fused ATPase/permease subunit